MTCTAYTAVLFLCVCMRFVQCRKLSWGSGALICVYMDDSKLSMDLVTIYVVYAMSRAEPGSVKIRLNNFTKADL